MGEREKKAPRNKSKPNPKHRRKPFTIEGEGSQVLQQGKRRYGAREQRFCLSTLQRLHHRPWRPGRVQWTRFVQPHDRKTAFSVRNPDRPFPAGTRGPAPSSRAREECDSPSPKRPGLICKSFFNLEIFIQSGGG